MSARDMNLKVMITGDSSGLDGAMKNVGASLKGLATSIAGGFGLGFAASAVARNVKQAIAYADELRDASESLGIGVESLQALNLAGVEAGASAQKMSAALQRLQAAQAAMAGGSKDVAAAFQALGIDRITAQALPLDRIMELIGKRLQGASTASKEYDAALQLLGQRGMATVLAALKSLAENGLDNFTSGMKAAGLIIDDAVTARLDKANKKIEQFKAGWRAFWAEVAASVLPETKDEKADKKRYADTFSQVAKELGYNEKPESVYVRGGGYGAGKFDTERGYAEVHALTLERIAAEDAAARKKADDDARAAVSAQMVSDLSQQTAAQDEKNRVARLTDAERLLEIEKQIRDTRLSLEDTTDEVDRQSKKLAISNLESQAIPLRKAAADEDARKADEQKRKQEAETREIWRAANERARQRDERDRQMRQIRENTVVASPVAADSIAQIGGQIGLQTQIQQNAVQRQVRLQEQMVQYLQRIAEQDAANGVTE